MNTSKSSWRRNALLAGIALAVVATPAAARHAWKSYHWARTTGELAIPIGVNTSANWVGHVDTAIADWNQSTLINSPKVPGTSTDPVECAPVSGTIQVCNSAYGDNGWLGIAQIWLANGHISQGVTKLNDTYFNTPKYNTYAWRQLVTCQEIGHDYGLGHQDENFQTDRTRSCMDYTSLPEGNEHPDAHDYEQLVKIYNHTESATSTFGRGATGAKAGGNTMAQWGRPISFTADGRPDVFQRMDASGMEVITHVFWAPDQRPHGRHDH